MMQAETQRYFAKIRFTVPDLTISADERALFTFPANKDIVEEQIELHDVGSSPELVEGAGGLDAQGFAYIKHRSALLDADQWYTGKRVEEVYLPEMEELVCKVTGANRAVVNNVVFRRKLGTTEQEDPNFVYLRGSTLDKHLETLPKDIPLVVGKNQNDALEPACKAHIDYTLQGLRESARYCRKDIKAAAQPALDAEDANAANVPRYAAYSVWRPVKTVTRDPLAVCDWRTLDREKELQPFTYRALSNVNESGEFHTGAYSCLPPKHPIEQKWYWMPEQKEDDVLIIKFADTAAEMDPHIAGGCPHVSFEAEGTENEEPRESIECRVLAFW